MSRREPALDSAYFLTIAEFSVALAGFGRLAALIGIAAVLGPGFPIADSESKPLLQTYSQALASLA